MNDGGRVREDDRDGIEADLAPFDARARGVGSGGPYNVLLLLCADSAIGTAKIGRGPGFDFNENDGVPLARNNVDFRIFAGAVISSDHREPGAS